MSIHRFAARRDANEPEIIARLAHHGWHTEQVSGTGMPDLLAIDLRPLLKVRLSCVLVDVKDGKGQPTAAQVKKWTALYAKGIPVYVVRTEDDVDALVAGTLEPWKPATKHAPVEVRTRLPGKVRKNYTPPRSEPVDAAKEAEAFAPPDVPPCFDCGEAYSAKCYDRDAPAGAVSCTKDVHCTRYDGHPGDCRTIGPRCCTT